MITPPRPWAHDGLPDTYEGHCWICGRAGLRRRETRSMRETYACPHCAGSLRYQAQAQALIRLLSRNSAQCLKELAQEEEFRSLAIYEPGTLGPFRGVFESHPHYETSAYWPDVREGDYRDGMRCENLMSLTYEDDRFDLVITSDIFEHVRRPLEGFSEVARVLRPHGFHVFSIPVEHPLRERSVHRVSTARPDDVPILEPVHHNGHLVYTDFGADLLEQLGALGCPSEAVRFESSEPTFDRLLTFVSVALSDRPTATEPIVGREPFLPRR